MVSLVTADVPNGQDAKRVGDTRIEIEVAASAELGRPPLALFVETKAGVSEPYPLLTEPAEVLAEVEPNDGFRQAQPLAVPGAVDGRIERPQDVDVYRVEGRAGQVLRLELVAARRGSALDGALAIYDAHGSWLAGSDDRPTSLDPQLAFLLPHDGSYFVAVTDALDQGGPAHPYRLAARLTDPRPTP
jgi:hypothetical protein